MANYKKTLEEMQKALKDMKDERDAAVKEKDAAYRLGYAEGKRYAEMWTCPLDALIVMCKRKTFGELQSVRCAYC